VNKWSVLTVGAIVAMLAGCGVASEGQQWTAQEVIKTFKRETQTTLKLDPTRSDREVSVLVDPAKAAGYYDIWVFKPETDSIDYDIGGLSVPPHGVLTWGRWKGVPFVMRTYGNVVLSYDIDADEESGKGARRPELPRGFHLVDSALSALKGFRGDTVMESMSADDSS
jgi:hypothetical protein